MTVLYVPSTLGGDVKFCQYLPPWESVQGQKTGGRMGRPKRGQLLLLLYLRVCASVRVRVCLAFLCACVRVVCGFPCCLLFPSAGLDCCLHAHPIPAGSDVCRNGHEHRTLLRRNPTVNSPQIRVPTLKNGLATCAQKQTGFYQSPGGVCQSPGGFNEAEETLSPDL